MDFLVLVRMLVAFTVYPGGLFFLAATYGLHRLLFIRDGFTLRGGDVAALLIASFGAALLPLPGSPLQSVGAASLLFAALLFAIAGLSLGSGGSWPRPAALALASLILPLLLLSAASTSPALTTIATLPGTVALAARGLVAVSLSLLLPLIASNVANNRQRAGAIALIAMFEASIAWQMLSAASVLFALVAIFLVAAVFYARRDAAPPFLNAISAETVATATAIPALAAALLLLYPS